MNNQAGPFLRWKVIAANLTHLGDSETVRRYLNAAEIRMRSISEERDSAQAESERLSDRYMMSERRIAALKAAQHEFMTQLSNRTGAQIASLGDNDPRYRTGAIQSDEKI